MHTSLSKSQNTQNQPADCNNNWKHRFSSKKGVSIVKVPAFSFFFFSIIGSDFGLAKYHHARSNMCAAAICGVTAYTDRNCHFNPTGCSSTLNKKDKISGQL